MRQWDVGRFFGRQPIGERLAAQGIRADLAAAVERTASDVRLDRTVAALQTLVDDDEKVEMLVLGRANRSTGVLVLTSTRVMFLPVDATEATFAGLRADLDEIEVSRGRLHLRLGNCELVIDRLLGRSGQLFAAAAGLDPDR